jgi:hypothetical protein
MGKELWSVSGLVTVKLPEPLADSDDIRVS